MENLKSQIRFIQEIQTKETIDNAKQQAKKIIEDATKKSDEIRSKKMTELEIRLREKEAYEIAVGKLEGKKKALNVKFHLLEETFENARVELQQFAGSKTSLYEESLEKFIVEAASKLNGTEMEILTNPKDRDFVNSRIKELEKGISKLKHARANLRVSQEMLDNFGGVVVRTADKEQVFDNTMEARLTRIRQTNRNEIFDSLFGKAGE